LRVIRHRLTVHGRVQGVGFRYSIARAAHTRGVTGWVANRADGAVEAVLEGEPDAVESVTRFAREGPRGAVVDRVDIADEEPEGLRGFSVR
jgi:acylphosphatase